jgi:hypothetical protein
LRQLIHQIIVPIPPSKYSAIYCIKKQRNWM